MLYADIFYLYSIAIHSIKLILNSSNRLVERVTLRVCIYISYPFDNHHLITSPLIVDYVVHFCNKKIPAELMISRHRTHQLKGVETLISW